LKVGFFDFVTELAAAIREQEYVPAPAEDRTKKLCFYLTDSMPVSKAKLKTVVDFFAAAFKLHAKPDEPQVDFGMMTKLDSWYFFICQPLSYKLDSSVFFRSIERAQQIFQETTPPANFRLSTERVTLGPCAVREAELLTATLDGLFEFSGQTREMIVQATKIADDTYVPIMERRMMEDMKRNEAGHEERSTERDISSPRKLGPNFIQVQLAYQGPGAEPVHLCMN
jgi:hypothetical protein